MLCYAIGVIHAVVSVRAKRQLKFTIEDKVSLFLHSGEHIKLVVIFIIPKALFRILKLNIQLQF